MQLQDDFCPGSSIYHICMLREIVAAGSVRQAFPSDTEMMSGELMYASAVAAQLDLLTRRQQHLLNIAG